MANETNQNEKDNDKQKLSRKALFDDLKKRWENGEGTRCPGPIEVESIHELNQRFKIE